METEHAPWLFAIVTAGWFGWMANRSGRSWALWAVGGGAFGLLASTLVVGLGDARSISFSDHDRFLVQVKGILVAALLILGIGWLLTSGLHRPEAVNQSTFSAGPSSEPTTVAVKSAPPVKQPSAKPQN